MQYNTMQQIETGFLRRGSGFSPWARRMQLLCAAKHRVDGVTWSLSVAARRGPLHARMHVWTVFIWNSISGNWWTRQWDPISSLSLCLSYSCFPWNLTSINYLKIFRSGVLMERRQWDLTIFLLVAGGQFLVSRLTQRVAHSSGSSHTTTVLYHPCFCYYCTGMEWDRLFIYLHASRQCFPWHGGEVGEWRGGRWSDLSPPS